MNAAVRSIPALLVGILLASPASAAFITNVTKVQGNGTAINLLPGGLAEGVLAYTDRTHVLVNILDRLEGADLVQVSNSDKTSSPYEVDVTLGRLSLLYLALDNRLTDGNPATPAVPFAWMSDGSTGLPGPFFDTEVDIDIDESNDGDVDQAFSLWVTLAPAGTYKLFEQNDGGSRNMYMIMASDIVVVPEPASMVLCGLGILGLAAARRRRNR